MSPRVPSNTYRLQLHAEFGFAAAARIAGYLDRLGVGALYTSPVLAATPGSTHGYDICDFGRLNPELGSDADFADFAAALRSHGLGLVVDWVPNHMGADAAANLWWRDVLEDGPSSPYAAYFDVDWRPVKQELEGKVLLPILSDQYGVVLERGELQVEFADGAFSLRCFERNLPLNPRELPRVLEHGIEELRAERGEEDPDVVELLSIITELRNLPADSESDADRVAERHREKQVARQRLARLSASSDAVRRHIDRALATLNGVPGEPRSLDALHALLEQQSYRLSYWRTAPHEINYRRFFDINELAAVRMENPALFAAAHAFLLRLIGEGTVTGLRIDHMDGLSDPAQYARQLQAAIAAAIGEGAGDGLLRQPFYVVVEKILSAGESLREDWMVAGTSGYDFLNDLNGLFVDARGLAALRRIQRRFTRRRVVPADLVYECKRLITETSMTSELNVLAHALNRLSERSRRSRDFTLNSLREALREVVACFPVYRTYVTADGYGDRDRAIVESAIADARRRNPATESSVFDFLRSVLLPSRADSESDEEHAERIAIAVKTQQYTGPVHAKGLEDTAFYRYHVLASANEVGGDTGRLARGPAEFHEANRARRERSPLSMLATSTHDTKRGEDVRARLNVLSEIAADWGRQLSRWARINASHRRAPAGNPAPDRNDEALFYQLLIGSWPPDADGAAPADESFVARLRGAMLKAVREAKLHTSWITPNQAYEAAVERFVDLTLRGPKAERFLAAFLPFQQRVARLGMINSLAQVVLKIAAPGVPDFYQGSELWDLSLVDPDNRRPVDYEKRARMLEELEPVLAEAAPIDGKCAAIAEMLAHWQDGRIKLFVTAAALRCRASRRDVYLAGDYEPIAAEGAPAAHVTAFSRRHGAGTAIAVAPRLVAGIADDSGVLPTGGEIWGDARLVLREGCELLRNVFTGETLEAIRDAGRLVVPVAAVLRSCPVALLTCSGSEPSSPAVSVDRG